MSAVKTGALAILIFGAGVFAIALVSGLVYERVERAKDRENFPQIGSFVDIGGRMLNIYCSGEGQPAVVLESGARWTFYKSPKDMFEKGAPRPGYSWVWIQRELAKLTTACWFDPAGAGWSDLGPYPRDSASQARDLHALLEGAHVPPPYLLVAESSAALDARVFTGFYPAQVAGLVLINALHPDFLIATRPGRRGKGPRFPGFVGHSQDLAAQAFNQVGFYRLGLGKRPPPAPPSQYLTISEWNTIWHLSQASKARSALLQDIASWEQSTIEARAAGSLGDRPLIVVSSEDSEVATEYRRVWMEQQADLVRLSGRGRQEAVEETNGDLIYEAPRAITEVVRQVLVDVRQK
jgi:pimeloyl-ACP methyl ester carboxylesterase